MKTIKTLSILLLLSVFSLSGYAQNFVESEQPEAVENQLFGYSISSSYDWAVITAPQKDIGDRTSIGSAFFYRLTDEGWVIEQEVTPEGLPTSSNFGISAKMSGYGAFIGSLGSENGILMQETVFIYEFSDTAWVQQHVLRPDDAKLGSRFGYSLDVKSGSAVIGAYQADGAESKSGAAYVFELGQEGWEQTAKLVAEDGESNDSFGHSVVMLEYNLVAVSAYNATGAEERSGAVYIFEKDNEGAWNQVAKLYDPNGSSSDLFGYSIAATVSVFIPVKTNPAMYYGTLFVGAPGSNNDDGIQTGAVYFYNEVEGEWFMETKLIDEEAGSNDHFGIAIAQNTLSGLFIGANRSGVEDEGKIYGYNYRILTSEIEAFTFTGNSSASPEQFYGSRITTDQSANIIIASPYNSVEGNDNSGSVEFYRTPITSTDGEPSIVTEYKLDQNYPNPFNPTTTINYQVKDAGLVRLTVFNLLGQEVQVLVNEQQATGTYTATFNASSLASGFYFYSLEVNDFKSTKKMMLIK